MQDLIVKSETGVGPLRDCAGSERGAQPSVVQCLRFLADARSGTPFDLSPDLLKL